jgi:hypothetical protein
MRTVEVLFVIIILLGAFIITTQFAVLPSPSQAFGTNLRELSQSTLETLDAQGTLSETVFKDTSDPAWGDLQKAISASLPPNVVYNLSVYDLSANSQGVINYQLANSISDAGFGADSDASSLMLTSPNVTFTQDPQKVGESTGHPITLYILNCNDANGWWITGYTGQSLASDFYNLLSPYFTTTVLINTTDQLGSLLDNSLLEGIIQNAVVVNTFGEAVPIPDDYCVGGPRQDDGYEGGSYAKYCHTLGSLTRQYNWTWVSIVGYPVHYVSNTEEFTGPTDQNGYGIYGMKNVGPAGLTAFLRGLNGEDYSNIDGYLHTSAGDVTFNADALKSLNYYGIYPSITQTSTRTLRDSILTRYNLVATELFNRPPLYPTYIPAATYSHDGGGALTAIGLARIPDIRVAALALLMYYQPTVYRSEFGASGTSRLVTLQLGQQGGT